MSTGDPQGAPGLKIGQVASYSGVPVKTIRFYCDEGLIRPATRSDGGYRLFDDSIYAELSLIRTLRAMDVPLSELRRILEVRRSGFCNCGALKTSIQSRVESINQRMIALESMRKELVGLVESWRNCGGMKES